MPVLRQNTQESRLSFEARIGLALTEGKENLERQKALRQIMWDAGYILPPVVPDPDDVIFPKGELRGLHIGETFWVGVRRYWFVIRTPDGCGFGRPY